jgi:lysophospholipase L1-like esterase
MRYLFGSKTQSNLAGEFCACSDLKALENKAESRWVSTPFSGLMMGENSISSLGVFFFGVKIPEGNYRVTVEFGGACVPSRTTLKLATRRLFCRSVETKANGTKSVSFCVNQRSHRISGLKSVQFHGAGDKEKTSLDWGRDLVFEFSDTAPAVSSIEIHSAPETRTVFLAGDSTVTNQVFEPWCSWGQMLPAFLVEDVAVANYAQSGESLKSFIDENRLDKILSVGGPGDWLFVQFGHNDQKKDSPTYSEADTSYKALLNSYITRARSRGINPVLVTPMLRRSFDECGHIVNTLENYPDAVRECSSEMNVPLLDLNADSRVLFETLGVEGSKKAFVHFPSHSFPDQDTELKDDSHFCNYGAYQLAHCIIERMRASSDELSSLVRSDVPQYSPSSPESFESWDLPLSLSSSIDKPEGY